MRKPEKNYELETTHIQMLEKMGNNLNVKSRLFADIINTKMGFLSNYFIDKISTENTQYDIHSKSNKSSGILVNTYEQFWKKCSFN